MSYPPEFIKTQNRELQIAMDMAIKELLPQFEQQLREAIGIDVNLTILLIEPPHESRGSIISCASSLMDMTKLRELFMHVTQQIISGVEISIIEDPEPE